ncbi:MAG TPA: AraC family transcriptional regulator [Polyangiaceae bacterium]|nr:AraC family transcriptional regulator [Polyangiaceae bacterium]
MAAKAHGRILFWEGASLWILRAAPGETYPQTDRHAHHAVQLSFALAGTVELEDGNGRVAGQALAVAPDAPHAFLGTGLVAHLFVASDGGAGRELRRALFPSPSVPIVPIPAGLLANLPAQLRATFETPQHTEEALRALGRELIARLAGTGQRRAPFDPRMDRLVRWLAARLDEPVRLGDVASCLQLSPGRTRHLFVEQTGLTFRTYLLWLRLMRAVEIFAGGDSLTEAAHRAGFADSAHLSRTFRRMFGIAAASLRLA